MAQDQDLTTDGSGGSEARDPAEVHRDIQRTRAEIDSTLNAIERKLSPDRLKYEAGRKAGELAHKAERKAGDVYRQLPAAVRERPVAAVAVGAGVGWVVGKLVRKIAGR